MDLTSTNTRMTRQVCCVTTYERARRRTKLIRSRGKRTRRTNRKIPTETAMIVILQINHFFLRFTRVRTGFLLFRSGSPLKNSLLVERLDVIYCTDWLWRFVRERIELFRCLAVLWNGSGSPQNEFIILFWLNGIDFFKSFAISGLEVGTLDKCGYSSTSPLFSNNPRLSGIPLKHITPTISTCCTPTVLESFLPHPLIITAI